MSRRLGRCRRVLSAALVLAVFWSPAVLAQEEAADAAPAGAAVVSPVPESFGTRIFSAQIAPLENPGGLSGQDGLGAPAAAPLPARIPESAETLPQAVRAPAAAAAAPIKASPIRTPESGEAALADVGRAVPDALRENAPAAGAAAPEQARPARTPLAQAERLAGPATYEENALTTGFDGEAPSFAPDEAETIFARANPHSPALNAAGMLGLRFSDFAGGVVKSDVFSQLEPGKHDFEHIVPVPPSTGLLWRMLKGAAKNILDFADRADRDPAAARFVELLAKHGAFRDFAAAWRQRDLGHQLPAAPLERGEYWDLAAGPNAAHLMMGRLNPKLAYKFFDSSPYVVEYLNETRRMLASAGAAAPIEIVRADVRQLARPPTPIAVLRAKNVWSYVQNFAGPLERMTEWIAPGGVLLLQTDKSLGQKINLIDQLGRVVERLLASGWTLNFDAGRHERDLETLTLTRPSSSAPDPASIVRWRRYADGTKQEYDEALRRYRGH